MAEEQVDEEVVEQVQSEQIEVDPIEVKAAEMGWKKDFDGEPEDFIDAREFIRRKPLFDKMESQKKQLKEMDKALRALQTHHEAVKATEYQRAVNTLKAEKKAALESGDADELIRIDDAIADVKAEERANKQVAKVGPDPRFVEWVNENQWYAKDAELRQEADEIGVGRKNLHPELGPEEILEYVEKKIKKLYPSKFRNSNKDKPSSVEGSVTTTPTRSTKVEFELTDEERRVMNTFIRTGALTKEQYIDDLKAMKGIK